MGKIWCKKKTFARQFSMGKKNPKLRKYFLKLVQVVWFEKKW